VKEQNEDRYKQDIAYLENRNTQLAKDFTDSGKIQELEDNLEKKVKENKLL